MRNAGLDELQTGIKIAGRNNLRYADDTTLTRENEELKSLLVKVKEGSEKAGLKRNVQKMKITASGPIVANRWKQWKQWQTIFLGSKITAHGDCSHEIKRCLLLGRKVVTNLDSILKSWDITLPTKIRLVKAMVFSVLMYGCESWTTKTAECWRIDAFELWYWRRTPLNSKEIKPVDPKENQSWIFIGRTDAEAQAPVLLPPIAKNWLTEKRPWCWERLKAGREGDGRGWDGWMASLTRWTGVWANFGSWWWTSKPGVLQSMGSQKVGHNWANELKTFWPLTVIA